MENGVDFKEVAVAELGLDLIKHLADNPADVAIKIAALRGAADMLQQTVVMQGFAANLANILLPPRK